MNLESIMKVKNLTLNINMHSNDVDYVQTKNSYEAREMLVDVLRCASMDKNIIGQKVIIPDDCEKYGFVEGNFDVSAMIHFLADMLE